MKENTHVRIYRMESFHRESINWKETLSWYRLVWFDDGRGILFLAAGTDFPLDKFYKGGWIVLVSAQAYFNFLDGYPQFKFSALFEVNVREASISTDPDRTVELNHVAENLEHILNIGRKEIFQQQYINLLMLHANDAYAEKHVLHVQGRDAEVMHKLNSLIDKNFRTFNKTRFYADELYLPAKELNRISVRITALNVRENINQRRLSKAKNLLLTTEMSIKAIALELNYLTQGHFSTYFKEKEGCSPSDFKKKTNIR